MGREEHGQGPQEPPRASAPGQPGTNPTARTSLSPEPPAPIQQPVMSAKPSWGFFQCEVLCTAHARSPPGQPGLLPRCPGPGHSPRPAGCGCTPPAPRRVLQGRLTHPALPLGLPTQWEQGRGRSARAQAQGPLVCRTLRGRHGHQGSSTHHLGQSCLQGLFGQPSFLPTGGPQRRLSSSHTSPSAGESSLRPPSAPPPPSWQATLSQSPSLSSLPWGPGPRAQEGDAEPRHGPQARSRDTRGEGDARLQAPAIPDRRMLGSVTFLPLTYVSAPSQGSNVTTATRRRGEGREKEGSEGLSPWMAVPPVGTQGSARLATRVRPSSGPPVPAKPDGRQAAHHLGPREASGGLHPTQQMRGVTPEGEARVPKSENQGALRVPRWARMGTSG